jgi:hypothetical protein
LISEVPPSPQHVHVLVEAQVDEPGARAEVALRRLHLGLVHQLQLRVGELAGQELPAALEQADVLPRARQSRRGDRTAVPGADHDHRVVVAHAVDRRRQARELVPGLGGLRDPLAGDAHRRNRLGNPNSRYKAAVA